MAQGILVPMLFGVLFAILLMPLVSFCRHKLRFPKILAIAFAILFSLFLVSALVYFISLQVGAIAEDWTNIKLNLLKNYLHLQQWIKEEFNISFPDQNRYVEKLTMDSIQDGKSLLGNTLTSFTGTLLGCILVPFYAFLILVYQNLFITFLYRLMPSVKPDKILGILLQIKTAVHSFLLGTLMEMGIISVFTCVGLLAMGVKYAVLLGIITGLLNLIPYIGILVATGLTLFSTLTVTAHASTVVGVLILNAVLHLIDANVLVPLVVSSKVKMNAFISLTLIVIGNHLAGIAGMFLAIPMAGILKIIFDEVEFMKPWGYLFGNVFPNSPIAEIEPVPVEPEIFISKGKRNIARALSWLAVFIQKNK